MKLHNHELWYTCRSCGEEFQNLHLIAKLNYIMRVVSVETGIPEMKIKSSSRKEECLTARQIFCLIAKRRTTASFAKIAYYLSGRDHTTAINAYNRATAYYNDRERIFMATWSRVAKLAPKYLMDIG